MADRRKRGKWPAIILAGRPEAPALAEWILRTREAAEGLSLVPAVSAITGVSEPTVRAGGPVEPRHRMQFVDKLSASALRRVEGGSKMGVDLAAHLARVNYPPSFALFAGGYSTPLFEVCDAVDRISEAVATCQWTRSHAAQAIVELGSIGATKAVAAPPVAPVDLVALDATLMVLARLDMEVLLDHQDRRYPVRSLFLRVCPRLAEGRVKRWPYARLLDRLYMLTCIQDQRPLKDSLPTIARLEAMLGIASAQGFKSRVTKWRTGRALHSSDYLDIAARCLGEGQERFLADKLYAGATFWHVLLKEAPEHVEWAFDRFNVWWSVFRPEDFVDGPEPMHVLNAIA